MTAMAAKSDYIPSSSSVSSDGKDQKLKKEEHRASKESNLRYTLEQIKAKHRLDQADELEPR